MQRWFFAASFLWLTPVLAVGAGGLGLPPVPALLAAAAAAGLIAWPSSRALAGAIRTDSLPRRLYFAALGVAAVAAIVRIATVSVFMADVRKIEFSVEPEDPFRRVHSCMSAYEESARLLAAGEHDIYHAEHYRPGGTFRSIGPLRVDPFHYPPPFLFVPQAVRAVAPDFWDFRRVWFALQAVVFAMTLVALAAWIGDRAGAFALLTAAIVLAMPHPVATLQQGNFQITAVPLAVGAFVLLLAGRHFAGGGVLAYAAMAKIFPGILLVPLLTGRRWRAVAWVAGMGVLLLALSVLIHGVDTYRGFITTSLPEISSGAAFPQTEWPVHSRVNFSAYGQTVRFRQLGVTWLTQPRGLLIAELYGLAVALFAAWAGWRARFDVGSAAGRAAVCQFAVALVSLASFRSPFVGAVYGTLATFWLTGLLAATSTRHTLLWLTALLVLAAGTWALPSPAHPHSTPWVLISGALLFVCMGINAWAVVTVARPLVERDQQPAVVHDLLVVEPHGR